MPSHTLLAFAAISALSIMTPGPAVLLTLRNGATHGAKSVLRSAAGNIAGMFMLSAAAMLGLGALMNSSALLFGAVKLIGALYLFYIGLRALFARVPPAQDGAPESAVGAAPTSRQLFAEAILTATTNPKALLYFTALFPQFVDAKAALLPQFFTLTGIFMVLAYAIHMAYAALASRARRWLIQPRVAVWMKRVFGAVFITFGTLLLTVRRQAA
ncbi:LysE family translocator [Massilia glaciei]|uniref:LysE family translocator n=1 Tax=Massilia glaciei TaxID=1524097 RepID=A0A2U2I5I9_9BURK|nr:LysE family translocator [Massilia glaciei]PWF55021.1 LysE family translocator [Massilia glaciei]